MLCPPLLNKVARGYIMWALGMGMVRLHFLGTVFLMIATLFVASLVPLVWLLADGHFTIFFPHVHMMSPGVRGKCGRLWETVGNYGR